MTYSIAATVTALEDRMQLAGYSASMDPERVNPPGVWLSPRTVTDRTLAGGGSLVLWLYLIAPNVAAHQALALLDDLLEGLDDLDLAVHAERPRRGPHRPDRAARRVRSPARFPPRRHYRPDGDPVTSPAPATIRPMGHRHPHLRRRRVPAGHLQPLHLGHRDLEGGQGHRRRHPGRRTPSPGSGTTTPPWRPRSTRTTCKTAGWSTTPGRTRAMRCRSPSPPTPAGGRSPAG
jgi:hypothetical protein